MGYQNTFMAALEKEKQKNAGGGKPSANNNSRGSFYSTYTEKTQKKKEEKKQQATASDIKKEKQNKEKKETKQSSLNRYQGEGGRETKDTRADKVLRGALENTASSLTNFLGMFADKAAETRNDNAFVEAKLTNKSADEILERNKKEGQASQELLYNKADDLAEKSAKEISSAKEGLGKGGQLLVDAGVGGTQLLGDMAANLVVPGSGLVSMGARAFGSGAQEQRQKGGSEADQFLGGLKSASIEMLTEKIGGPFEKVYGKSFLGKAINNGVEKLSKSGAMADVLKYIAKGGTEAVEEVVSDILNPLADRLLDLDGKRGSGEAIGVFSKENVQQMVDDALVGGILGLVGVGGQVVGDNVARSQQRTAAQEIARDAAQEALAGRQQTTPPAEVNADTAQQAQLNSAVQNEQPQEAANPVVAALDSLQTQQQQTTANSLIAAIQNIQNQQAPTIVAKVEQTIDDIVATSMESGEALSDEQAFAEIAQYPEQYGLTTEDVEAYSANLRDDEFEVDNEFVASDDGLGAANLGSLDAPNPVGEWQSAAIEQGEDAVHNISDEQVQNRLEQQNAVPVDVPKVDINGKLTSKTVSTLANSGVTPEAMSDAIMQDAMNGKFSHIAYTDEAAQTNAEAKIQDIGWEQALGEYRKDVLDGKVSKDITMLGVTLYNNAVTAGDYAGALDIVSLMTQNSTTMAQGLQAMRILNKLSPDARLYMAVKSAENIAAEIKQKYNLDDDIEIDPDLLGAYKEALDSGDNTAIREAWGNVEQNIADQIPSNWKDKFNAWRYLSMLGNPRTHVRNIVGNAGFAPVIAIKNAIATGIEAGVEAVGGNINRTKAILNPASASDRALIATAWADYANASEAIMSGGKYNDLPNTIDDRRQIFNFKPVEAVRKFNSNALNVEDKWFSQPAYANALASYLKANGISANEYASGNMSEEALTKAQEYAVKEAQKATYRDTNAFSQAISKFRVKPAKADATRIERGLNKAANIAVEGLLPFKKTPANILARAVEYSPIGLGAEVLTGVRDVKNGTKTAAEFIDGLSAGLTGTGLLSLGIYLASQGLLSGGASGDDKQDEFDKLQGGQNYALSVGDKTVTLDWLAPEALPVFVGVELWNNMLSGESNASLWDALDSLGNISEPMLEMSMLQGIQDIIDSVGYSDKKIQGMAGQIATSYISQFVPTLFGQIERSFTEDTRQSTFYDRNNETPTSMQSFLGKLFNKTPGEYQQMDYIDAWGRTQSTGTVGERAFNNFFNPAYVSDKRTGEVESELQRLYDLGFGDVLPQRAAMSTQVNGNYLSQEDYSKFATVKGQTSLELVEQLMSSSVYSNLSDAAKAEAIATAYTYANDEAKLAVDKNADVPSWHNTAKESGDPGKYIQQKAELAGVESEHKSGLGKLADAAQQGVSDETIESGLSDNQRRHFEYANTVGDTKDNDVQVNAGDFAEAYNYYYNDAAAIARERGASNSRQVHQGKVALLQEYINNMDGLSAAEKKALYDACIISDNKLKK